MVDDLRFKHPFTCIVSGPTGSGKSSFCIRFQQNLETMCTERHFDGGIVWCYSEKAAIPKQQLAVLGEKNKIRFQEGVPENLDNLWGKPCLLILDDLLNEVYSQPVCACSRKAAIIGTSVYF